MLIYFPRAWMENNNPKPGAVSSEHSNVTLFETGIEPFHSMLHRIMKGLQNE